MRLSPTRIATRTSILLAGACIHWSAMAQQAGASFWRCGSTYTDRPCPAGQPLALDDARSPAQKREADRATRAAQAEAARMERDRLRLESMRGPWQATLIDNAPRPRDNAAARDAPLLKKPKASKETRYLGAQDPGTAPKKKRSKANPANALKG